MEWSSSASLIKINHLSSFGTVKNTAIYRNGVYLLTLTQAQGFDISILRDVVVLVLS